MPSYKVIKVIKIIKYQLYSIVVYEISLYLLNLIKETLLLWVGRKNIYYYYYSLFSIQNDELSSNKKNIYIIKIISNLLDFQ